MGMRKPLYLCTMNICLNYDFKMIGMMNRIFRHKTVRHKTSSVNLCVPSVALCVEKNIQHRGAEFTELHRAPLRSPLRLCVKNSNAKKYQHEGTKAERHEESLVSKSLVSNSLKSQIINNSINLNLPATE